MAYTRFRMAAFGAGKAGLATVGYQLFDSAGAASGSRITAGVVAMGGGAYGASVAIAEGFRGFIKWDTGEATPAVAAEEIDPEGAQEHVKLDFAQAVPASNTAQTVGDALNAARAQGFGRWVMNPTAVPPTLTLYAADGATVVRTFTLNDSTSPTQRT